MDQESKTTSTTPPPPRKKWGRRVLVFLLLLFIAMQFIQPGKNNQSMNMTNDISTMVTVPDTVHQLLKIACYDCHSNFTNYPWYSNIQPVGWWLKSHIDDGKKHLNFQTFSTLQPRPNSRWKTQAALQVHQLEDVKDSQTDGWMPLESYTFIHHQAKLSNEQRQLIINWVDSAIYQINNSSKK